MKNRVIAVCLGLLAVGMQAGGIVSDKNIKSLLQTLTLDQKARLLVGCAGSDAGLSHRVAGAAGWTFPIEELGIPSVNLADGPVGVRINPVASDEVDIVYDESGIPVVKNDEASVESGDATSFCTCFPSTTALAATWNVEDAAIQGSLMGDEACCYGVDIVLTPGINIMRNPLCGRNFEYYSEDPLLTGKMASAMIRGIQQKGVGTSLKHFVANNQQTGKKYNDARMTRRALREIYLKGFEICVKEAKPWTVMGSYNKIAGEFTQTNRELMVDLLREEWGYEGLVLTDWTVRRPTDGLLNARCALMMPGEEEIVREIVAAVETGKVSRQTLDLCVADVLRLVAKSLTAKGWHPATPDLSRHAEESRRIATEGMVLLKNEGMALPLAVGSKVALFGATAYQSIAGGTGSSNVNKRYVVDIADGLAEAGYAVHSRLADVYRKYASFQSAYLERFPDCPDWQKISYHRLVVPEMDLSGCQGLTEEALRESDVAIVVVGRGSGETSDRVVENDFNLTEEECFMISQVCEVAHRQGKRVIVVLNVCGTIETASWSALPDAVLLAWFPGQECGYAVADVVSGRVNPSGRLPMTFPVAYADMPSAVNYPFVGQTEGENFDYTNYEEDIWVGYRYFSTTGKKTAYPFGFGLSYTDFDYSGLTVARKGGKLTVNLTVTNVGKTAGREVVQVYVSAPQVCLSKPEKELKAFAKTKLLKPGESESLTLTLDDYDLASYDEEHSRWLLEKGTYQVRVGQSSEETVLSAPFVVGRRRIWKTLDLLVPVAPVDVLVPVRKLAPAQKN